jgi:hypothetical protein
MGMPVLLYYLARHYTSSLLGWGPSYKLVIVQEDSARGLQQVRAGCACGLPSTDTTVSGRQSRLCLLLLHLCSVPTAVVALVRCFSGVFDCEDILRCRLAICTLSGYMCGQACYTCGRVYC